MVDERSEKAIGTLEDAKQSQRLKGEEGGLGGKGKVLTDPVPDLGVDLMGQLPDPVLDQSVGDQHCSQVATVTERKREQGQRVLIRGGGGGSDPDQRPHKSFI